MNFFKFFSVVILSFLYGFGCAQASAVRTTAEEDNLKDLASPESEAEKPNSEVPQKTETKSRKSKVVTKAKTELQDLADAFAKLQDAEVVSMKVNKKITSPWLTKPKEASGKLYFSKGKIRMKIEDPEPSLLVLAGKDIWLEEKQPKDFGGKIQVTHFKADRASKSSALLALLFGESEIWKELTLVEKKNTSGEVSFQLKPKDQKRLEIKDLKVVLSEKKHQLKAISYSDELENLTEYNFSSVKKSTTAKPELFKYSPPKGAEVTNF
jgi:outer membrane lipoprotein carrier protein